MKFGTLILNTKTSRLDPIKTWAKGFVRHISPKKVYVQPTAYEKMIDIISH